MDRSTYRIYSNNFCLNVLSLKQIENATQQDCNSGLYQWGQLFLAKTWEKLKMLAENNNTFKEVEYSMKNLSQNEDVIDICHMGEYDRQMREFIERKREREWQKEKEELLSENRGLEGEILRLKAQLAQYKKSEQKG